MRVSEESYRQIALDDPHGNWELHCGVLRQKPDMTIEHCYVLTRLFLTLGQQLDFQQFDVRVNMARVRRSSESYYVPDLFVVPMELVRRMRAANPRALDVYEIPLPLVVEVWSPSTGDYDVETKLPEYQQRGDPEIWRLHPYERTLTAWQRRPDGTYAETLYHGGRVQPVALPGVTIDLDSLYD